MENEDGENIIMYNLHTQYTKHYAHSHRQESYYSTRQNNKSQKTRRNFRFCKGEEL
jgi:hypothetical protein